LSTLSAPDPSAESPFLLLVAAEPSGDLHAAHLIEELRKQRPELRFGGFGGDQMREAGCETYSDPTKFASMGLGFLGSFGHYAKLMREFDRLLVEKKPAAVVLVDSPGLNFLFARLAKWRRVPVVYYILPQIWGWAPWRRGKVLKYTDLLLAILPFEEELYRNDRVRVKYVGHPLADELGDLPSEWGRELRERLSIPDEAKVVGIFPGSRQQEIDKLTPTFCRIAKKMDLDREKHRVVVSCFRDSFREPIEAAARDAGIEVDVVEGDSRALMQACDFAIVASGTASLQLGWFGKPMVVLYRTTKKKAAAFRKISVTPWIALPNILGSGPNDGADTVEERLFFDDSSEEIAPVARKLLDDGPERDAALERLRKMKEACFEPGSGVRASQEILAFLDARAPERAKSR